MRRLLLVLLAGLAGCGGDPVAPFGPGLDDPVCQRWEMVSWKDASLPVTEPSGSVILSGSLELLCTGWWRLSHVTDPVNTSRFFGRYVESGTTLTLNAPMQPPIIGTVTGAEMRLEPYGEGGWAMYRRVE